MNILHVNNVDLLGSRFNGHDMQRMLNAKGIVADQIVMQQVGHDPHTHLLPTWSGENYLQRRIIAGEQKLSIHAMIYPYLIKMMDTPEFQKADVVHYHLLHNYFGALPLLPKVTASRPSVLTVHDPWIFTGHCVYPRECDKWMTGCGGCPHLDDHFPMEKDRTALQWKIKQDIFLKADFDLIVASSYMMNLVKRSPITKHAEHIHLIPFGIDTNLFSLFRSQKEIRKRLGIPKENFVLFFRADCSKYKGLTAIRYVLDHLEEKDKITILSVGEPGLMMDYKDTYQLIDKGWVTDDNMLADLYSACDVFLMPSIEEAFGLMAIETMASGRPLVCFEGTSLPAVTFAPECGIAVKKNDAEALLAVVRRLRKSPEERRARGEMGRKLAEEHYRFEDYVERHIHLYEEILHRKQCGTKRRRVEQNG